MGWCCGVCCSSWDLLPQGHNDLTTAELQQLFVYSTNLNGGRLIVQGLFARADALNTNGRVYPKAVLAREVARFREQHVAPGTALGELNHPSYFSSYFRSLNLPNVSHQVLDLRWRGPELWGTLEVLPTPAGLLLSELYSKGIKLGVSSRGWASVVTDPRSKQVVVEPDYQLITFDFVPEPSNAGAYVVPICKRYRKRLPDQSAAVNISYLGIGSISMGQLQHLPPAAVVRRWLKHTSRAMDAAAKHPGQVAVRAAATAAGSVSASGGSRLLSSDVGSGSLSAPPQAALQASSPISSGGGGTSSSIGSCGAAGVSMLGALGGCAQQVLPPDTHIGGGVVLGCHYQVLHKPWLPLDTAVRQFKVHLSLMATKARLHQQQHAGPCVGPCDQQPSPQQQQQQQHLVQHDVQRHMQRAQQQQQQQQASSRAIRQPPFQQQQQTALEQPLLLRQTSDASTPSSQRLSGVESAAADMQQTGGLPPGTLLHVACDDAYSDSSLGPGTPRTLGTPRTEPTNQTLKSQSQPQPQPPPPSSPRAQQQAVWLQQRPRVTG